MPQTWTRDEDLAVVQLSYDRFAERYPERSRPAYAARRVLLRQMQEQIDAMLDDASESESDDDDQQPQEHPVEPLDFASVRERVNGARAHPSLSVHTMDQAVDRQAVSDDDLLSTVIAYQTARNRRFAVALDHDVVVCEKGTKTPITGSRPIALAFPSDWHIGNNGTDHKRIIEDIARIVAHPRLYCALGGDPVDNFIIEKMIAASREQLLQVDMQWALFRVLVERLMVGNSLLFVGAGNHDAWTHKVAGIDGITSALAGINIVNTGEGGFVRLQVGAQQYGIYRKHKPTRFSSGYNPHHFLEQMLRLGTPWDFDIGVSEHFHHAGIKWADGTDGSSKERVFVTTGSYKVVDPYAYGLGYYGGGYGVPCVVLWPDRREMWPVMRIEQAIKILDAS